MLVEGDPAPVAVVNPAEDAQAPQIALMLPEQARNASLKILDKIASELMGSADPAMLKLAKEVDEVAAELQKTAYVYQYDYVDPEPEINWAFQGGSHNEIPAGDGKKDAMKSFEKDKFSEVTQTRKTLRPFSKVSK